MKVRTGFVSNSSSSSFVVIFPRPPKSQDEVKQLLFPNGGNLPDPYDDYAHVSADEVAEQIWKDIRNQLPLHVDQISEELNYGYFDGMPDSDSYGIWEEKDKQVREKLWEKYDADCHAAATVVAEKFLKDNAFDPKGSNIVYIFHYGDNDGQFFSTLEHGGTFDALPNIRISKH